jgi:hypothetical protein
MRVLSGRVVGGKIVVDDDGLVEGATVTILADDEADTFAVSPEQQEELLAAIGEAERGELVSPEHLLEDLRRPM